MACNGFSNFTGCGKCNVSLNNKREISKLNPSSMSDIIGDIIDTFIGNVHTDVDLSCSSVSCTGSTDIIYLQSNKRRNLERVVLGLVRSWYVSNSSYAIELKSLLYIMGLVQVFSEFNTAATNEKNIDKFINVLNYIENITELPTIF